MDSDISIPHSENVQNAFRELIKREMPIQIIDTLEIRVQDLQSNKLSTHSFFQVLPLHICLRS